MKKVIFLLLMSMIAMAGVAQEIVRKGVRADSVRMVVVGRDTVNSIIHERNYSRFDRGLVNHMFIPKGKWGFGITASYGELNTEDVQVLSAIKDLDFNGKLYSVRPSVSYFFNNNSSVGLRFNYTRGVLDLGHMAVDFDDDINFTLKDVSYYQQSYGVGAFYRHYIGLDQGGRFGIFNEIDLEFTGGSSRFKRQYDGETRDTRTTVTQGALNFSPGVCVFLHDYVSFNVSFGVFGLKMRNEKQTTNGVDEGSRFSSGANFRFNIFNINFGLMVVI